MDPFDDFEFKPLTEGLGFHKKAEKARKTPSKSTRSEISSRDDGARSPSLFEQESAIAKITFESMPSFTLGAEDESSLLGRDTSAGSQSISELIASLPPSLDFIGDKEKPKSFTDSLRSHPPTQIFQPLARDEYKTPSAGPTMGQVMPIPGTKPSSGGMMGATRSVTSSGPSSATSALSKALTPLSAPVMPSSKYRDRLDESYARAFPHADKKSEAAPSKARSRTAAAPAPLVEGDLRPSPGHLGAGIVDAMVVTGMSTLLLVCILAITHVNLMGLLSNAETDGPTRIHLALLLIAVLQLYMLTARSFFGASLGEWAFDLQLGTSQDQQKTLFPLQSALRTLVITLTGFVILPVISAVTKKDVAAFAGGLQLFKRN